MPNEFDFNKQLEMSSGFTVKADVKSILLDLIPGAVAVTQAASENDKQGIDWWVELSTAKHLAVDAKVRSSDWAASHPAEDDLALETWSVVEKNVVGWTRDNKKRCDYVLWLWTDTGRYCLIPFPMLCKVFSTHWEDWRTRYRTARQKTNRQFGDSYHSECTFVPRREIWSQIYKHFGGDMRLLTTMKRVAEV